MHLLQVLREERAACRARVSPPFGIETKTGGLFFPKVKSFWQNSFCCWCSLFSRVVCLALREL